MRILPIATLLACGFAVPAQAGDTDTREARKTEDWSVAASGGATLSDGGGEQPFVRFGVTRFVGEGYVRASVTRFSTRQGAGLAGAVPASTWQATLAGGYRFGAVSIDGYGALGWRRFEREAYRRETGGAIEIDSNGRTASAGLTLSYEARLGENTLLVPHISGDISRVDIARAVNVVPRGTFAQKERQSGTTGSIGATLDRALARHGGHRAGVYAAFVATSNSAVALRSETPLAATALFGPLDVPGSKDSWGEYGLSATVRLSRALRLDLNAIRTAGLRGGESTSLSAGLRLRF